MRKAIDALDLLTQQHDELDELIRRVECADDVEMKAEVFRELADKLEAHAQIEEKLFYPAVLTDQTGQMLLAATEEHLAVKRVLADMLELVVVDERFDAKLAVLKEEVRFHTHEDEERQLFPVVRRMFDADQRAGLANEMLVMYEELLEHQPRLQVLFETREAAQLEMM